ncbi:hypothetical protein [Pseudoclavibacter sp. AY1H1]|uniref:hypothetical protein n=1 Tax=Pseudoclavibacter sp. AY1H1 TaxID=2080584 RepID=UPI0011B0B024|nr:hypothetical protein [Pseudoclavibacter sp. AY1H1]
MAKDQAEIGTLYLDDEGIAYRLTGFGFDWDADTPEKREVPDYVVHFTSGGSSETHSLPESAVVVWVPPQLNPVGQDLSVISGASDVFPHLTIRSDEGDETRS